MDLTEHLIFVNSVFTTYLSNIDHKTIIQSIEKIEKNYPSNKRSNRGGYQSPPFEGNNFDNNATMYLFQRYIVPAAQRISEAWNLPTEIDKFSYWYNVNKKYNYNTTHPHPNSYISGVYYLKVPANSGNIIFERSRDESDRMHFITSRIVANGNHTNNNRINTEHWFYPSEGLLVMFPGHLLHSVDQNLTDDDDDTRISLSFNFF